MAMSDTVTADIEERDARLREIVAEFETQRQRIGERLSESGFSAQKMAALARKNGVQKIGAQFLRVTEPDVYTEPAAPTRGKRIRIRL